VHDFSYSLPVSILVEIAEKADVPVEGVIRVLTREPVSDAVLERVLAVLDELTPEQTRAVQRFALAALHDVLPRPVGADNEGMVEDDNVPVHEGQLTLAALEAEEQAEQLPARSTSDAALVELSFVLSELAEAVRDLRRETNAERRERVDDLAVLIDLITTGWQGLDARLGRIEKQVARIDATRRRSAVPPPAPIPIPAAAARVEPAAERLEAPPARVAETGGRRRRLPLAAALTLSGAVIGTFAVLQVTSNSPDVAALVSARDDPAETGVGSSATTGAASGTSTTSRPVPTAAPQATGAGPPAAPARKPTTSSVLGTTVGKTRSTRTPPATAPARKRSTPAAPSFKPTRNWAWAPVADADYYSVQFTRGGKAFFEATPTEPRLTLPDKVVFVPGAYRWVVRPGFGRKPTNRLGPPVVNSGFTVS
jgi:hypothetical protein